VLGRVLRRILFIMLVLLIKRRVISKFSHSYPDSIHIFLLFGFYFTGNETDSKYRFYYADERKPDGSAAYSAIDGDAHAKHYVELAEGKTQGPWQQTFVKGVGYKAFVE
jgi:hypothetical protein